MANEILGHVTCPFCGNAAATVHREARGLRSLYYRCYSDDVAKSCGTVQIRYESGQTWIKANMRALNLQEQDKAVAAAVDEAKTKQEQAARTVRKRSRLAALLMDEDED